MGLLIDSDATLFRGFFKEMAKLRGIRGKYQYVLPGKDYTIYSELKATYSESLLIDMIFEEVPTQKTLRKHGWFSEDKKDSTPHIAHIPFDVPHLQKGCLIWIPSGLTDVYKCFRVEEISTVIEFPASLTVKLAPNIQDKVPGSYDNYQDTNTNYLRSEEGED